MNRSKLYWMVPLSLLALAASAPAPARDTLDLSLDECVRAAEAYSPELKEARFRAEAAKSSAAAVRTALLPTIGLNGNYAYAAQVLPAISLPANNFLFPGVTQVDFGFHDIYSVGVAANWDLLDVYSNWRSAQAAGAQTKAAYEALEDARQSLVLRVRLAYFQTQLAETQVRLYTEAVKLAQSQAGSAFHAVDLTDIAALRNCIDSIEATRGPIDVLINNAARDKRQDFWSYEPQDWKDARAWPGGGDHDRLGLLDARAAGHGRLYLLESRDQRPHPHLGARAWAGGDPGELHRPRRDFDRAAAGALAHPGAGPAIQGSAGAEIPAGCDACGAHGAVSGLGGIRRLHGGEFPGRCRADGELRGRR